VGSVETPAQRTQQRLAEKNCTVRGSLGGRTFRNHVSWVANKPYRRSYKNKKQKTQQKNLSVQGNWEKKEEEREDRKK